VASVPLNPTYLSTRWRQRKWQPAHGLSFRHSRTISPVSVRRRGSTLRRSRAGGAGSSSLGRDVEGRIR
jgi:hypothetical protein